MGHKRFLIGGLIAFGIIIGFEACLAAGARLNVNMGFGGYVVPGCWTPLTVEVKSPKNGMRVEIVRQVEEGLKPVVESFTYREGNKVECPLFVNEYYNQVTIRIFSGEQILTEQALETLPKTFPGHLVLALNLPAAVQQEIRLSLQPIEPILVVPIKYEEFPSLNLNYDGVSGLVLTDPGPILTPAQIRAIRGWLAGGGQMVILGARPFKESLGNLFIRNGMVSTREAVVSPIGLGSITIIPGNDGSFPGGRPGPWRQILKLQPYQQSQRLTASRCFPEEDPLKPAPNLSQGQNFLIIILVLWATAILLVGVIRFKNGSRYLLLSTVIFTILSFPAAYHLSGIWQRGALLKNRAIILPDAEGILLNTAVFFQKKNEFNPETSPWGIDIAWGQSEHGKIIPGLNRFNIWRHTRDLPTYVIQSTNTNSLKFTGWVFSGNRQNVILPPGISSVTGQIPVLWDGMHWRSGNLADPNWQKIIDGRIPASIDNLHNLPNLSDTPQWLANESEWQECLQRISPGSVWLFGLNDLSVMDLTVQGRRVSKVLWAKPLSKL